MYVIKYKANKGIIVVVVVVVVVVVQGGEKWGFDYNLLSPTDDANSILRVCKL